MGRYLFGLGLRDDIVEPFGRSVSGAARDGVRRTIDRNTRGGRDARGRYRRRVASADVLLLLLGLGRGVFGFRRGRDVLLVVRHRGARRGLHRARARFERGSPSAEPTHFLGGAARRRLDAGERVADTRSVAPDRGVASGARRETRARCVVPATRRTHARVGVRVERAGLPKTTKVYRGYSTALCSRPKVSFFFVVLERVGRLWGFMTRHMKWHRNERNAPMTLRRSTAFVRVVHSHASVYGAGAAPPALFAPPLRTPPGPVAGRSARLFARSAPAGHPTAPPAASGPSPSTNPYPTSALPDNGRPATGTASVRRLPPAVPNGGRGDVDPFEFRCLIDSGL